MDGVSTGVGMWFRYVVRTTPTGDTDSWKRCPNCISYFYWFPEGNRRDLFGSAVMHTLQLVLALLWQFDVRSYYIVVLKNEGKEIDSEASPEKITR